jgi:soluble lytic murein transglycosylase-like protein
MAMKAIAKCCVSLAVLALSSVAAFSAQLVILQNGFVMHVDHLETRGDMTRLYMDEGTRNFVDVQRDQIVRMEEIPEPPPPPLAPSMAPRRTVSLEEIVTTASNRYGIDPDIVLSLIHAESAFDPKAVSPKGAQGLMQLMPQTATSMGVENPMDAAANVEGGTRYLRELLTLYHEDLTKALAAYNAGPARVQEYNGVPPYRETINYINRVVRDLYQRKIARAHLDDHTARHQEKGGSVKPSASTLTSRLR